MCKRYHYWTQPLPHIGSWLAWSLPLEIHQLSTCLAIYIEIVAPFAIFLSSSDMILRWLAGVALVTLQCLIAMTGNFGFFNFLSAVLCVPLFYQPSTSTWMQQPNLPGLEHTAGAGAGAGTSAWVWWALVTMALLVLNAVSLVPLVRCFRSSALTLGKRGVSKADRVKISSQAIKNANKHLANQGLAYEVLPAPRGHYSAEPFVFRRTKASVHTGGANAAGAGTVVDTLDLGSTKSASVLLRQHLEAIQPSQTMTQARDMYAAVLLALISNGVVARVWGLLANAHGHLAAFRLLNAYGLFARMTTTRKEIVLLVRHGTEGAPWRPLSFKYKPGLPEETVIRVGGKGSQGCKGADEELTFPDYVGRCTWLHMPRLDWQMWFLALRAARGGGPPLWFNGLLHEVARSETIARRGEPLSPIMQLVKPSKAHCQLSASTRASCICIHTCIMYHPTSSLIVDLCGFGHYACLSNGVRCA